MKLKITVKGYEAVKGYKKTKSDKKMCLISLPFFFLNHNWLPIV